MKNASAALSPAGLNPTTNINLISNSELINKEIIPKILNMLISLAKPNISTS